MLLHEDESNMYYILCVFKRRWFCMLLHVDESNMYYILCVFKAVVIQRVMRMRRIVICGLSGCGLSLKRDATCAETRFRLSGGGTDESI